MMDSEIVNPLEIKAKITIVFDATMFKSGATVSYENEISSHKSAADLAACLSVMKTGMEHRAKQAIKLLIDDFKNKLLGFMDEQEAQHRQQQREALQSFIIKGKT